MKVGFLLDEVCYFVVWEEEFYWMFGSCDNLSLKEYFLLGVEYV